MVALKKMKTPIPSHTTLAMAGLAVCVFVIVLLFLANTALRAELKDLRQRVQAQTETCGHWPPKWAVWAVKDAQIELPINQIPKHIQDRRFCVWTLQGMDPRQVANIDLVSAMDVVFCALMETNAEPSGDIDIFVERTK